MDAVIGDDGVLRFGEPITPPPSPPSGPEPPATDSDVSGDTDSEDDLEGPDVLGPPPSPTASGDEEPAEEKATEAEMKV